VFFNKNLKEIKIKMTRTAWAVFKYCGTITVTLRMKKKYIKRLDFKINIKRN
jgi:hypothetical protein